MEKRKKKKNLIRNQTEKMVVNPLNNLVQLIKCRHPNHVRLTIFLDVKIEKLEKDNNKNK